MLQICYNFNSRHRPARQAPGSPPSAPTLRKPRHPPPHPTPIPAPRAGGLGQGAGSGGLGWDGGGLGGLGAGEWLDGLGILQRTLCLVFSMAACVQGRACPAPPPRHHPLHRPLWALPIEVASSTSRTRPATR